MTRPKILLVDDSALVRAVVTHALGNESMDLATIDDPRKLAAAMVSEAPTLLLVDATFPGIDQDTLASLVAPHAAGCTTVLFSDRPEDELAVLQTKIGAVGQIPKDAGATIGDRLREFLPK